MGTVISECLHCKRPVEVETADSEIPELRCGHCGTRQRQIIYPAYRRASEAPAPAPAPASDEGASCYFHESVGAVNLCDDCGRYLCELCTLPIPLPASQPADFPERLCPACFENRVNEEERNPQWDLFRTDYPRHDAVAIYLIILPVVLFPFIVLTIITFPVAFYVVLRNWRDCRTPVRHFRRSMVAALILASAGIILWLSIISFNVAGEL